MRPKGCGRPIPFADLVEYWLDDRRPEDPPDFEEHLFGCAECSASLEAVAALGEAIRRLGPSLLDSLERDGRVIRRYRAAAGGHIHCTAGADDDLIVLQLSADLAGVTRVDLLQIAADGTLLQRVPELPVIGGREVVWASPGDRIRALPTCDLFVRLIAVEPEGERPVGEFTLHHTAYRP